MPFSAGFRTRLESNALGTANQRSDLQQNSLGVDEIGRKGIAEKIRDGHLRMAMLHRAPDFANGIKIANNICRGIGRQGAAGEFFDEGDATIQRPLPSQAWIDRFTLQRKYTKDTLMHATQRFLSDETFESLDAASSPGDKIERFDDHTFTASSGEFFPPLDGRGLDYGDLYIQDGTAASRAFLRMISGDVSRDERKKIRSDLEAYCKRDTYGMILILAALKSLVEP